MDDLDQARRRAELYAIHREYHRKNFLSDGRWIGQFPRDRVDHSREYLWQAIVFLAGDETDIALGNAMIAQVPNVNNHFNPIAAADILLRYAPVLTPESIHILKKMINDSLSEAVDFALATSGLNNFTAMRAFLFLAASQVLKTYDVPYRHKSIPEIYNKFRLRKFGLNVLQLLENQLARTTLSQEFNSPNYSPLALWAMAEIVNLMDYEPARKSAQRIEQRLWEELLAFHHPRLFHTSGPYSRGYMVDSVGHATNWKILCCLLGLDGPTSVRELLYPPQEGQVIHAVGDLAFQQACAGWLIRADYHISDKIRSDFVNRKFPYNYQADYEWPGIGFLRPDGKVIMNVEGNVNPEGQGMARCYQTERFSIGSMSRTFAFQNHPCQIVYRVKENNNSLGSTRSIAAVMLNSRQPEFVQNPIGQRVVPNLLPNGGEFRTEQAGSKVVGSVQPHFWSIHFSEQGLDEISFNFFITEHLPLHVTVEKISLNGQVFKDSCIEGITENGIFIIEDGSVSVTCSIQTPVPVPFRVFRHGGFVRCMVVFYEGSLRKFTREDLSSFQAGFTVEVKDRNIHSH
ncbi:MAG: hypothetical protein WC975_12650 [Phycisphaerae bacterium]